MTLVSNDRRAGTLVPLFSMPSARSWGIGEISDLERMTAWLASAGQRLLHRVVVRHHLGRTPRIGHERLDLPTTDADAVLRWANHLGGRPQLGDLHDRGDLEIADLDVELLDVGEVGDRIALWVVCGRVRGGRRGLDRPPFHGPRHLSVMR